MAILTITSSGPEELTLSGIYSIQGKVKAIVKGNLITIPIQEVKDPNFANLMIKGELVFSSDATSVNGKITVANNQTKDECEVQYRK